MSLCISTTPALFSKKGPPLEMNSAANKLGSKQRPTLQAEKPAAKCYYALLLLISYLSCCMDTPDCVEHITHLDVTRAKG
jgi:hypothetical protein